MNALMGIPRVYLSFIVLLKGGLVMYRARNLYRALEKSLRSSCLNRQMNSFKRLIS